MLLDLVTPTLKELPIGLTSTRKKEKDDVSLSQVSLLTPTPEEKIEPAQIIDEIAQKALAGIPLRFIDLSTGTFSSSAELSSAFKRSSECQALMSCNFATPDVLAEQAETVVRTYFAYAMLSHMWGEDEPLHRDVLGKNIVEMSPSSTGVLKLQNFCRVAKQYGFRWCWSDTCCIDKSSSAELQESINSMFTWYRNSALTIVYLSDVFQSSPGSLRRSRWFTRGWTLQELLAPTTIQFYMNDWSPFLTSSAGAVLMNYKHIPQFVQCLEEILGVDKMYLVDFTPGLDNVREKLRWMAARKTTKAEDMAYCLLGILDLRLPILYGEEDRAFIRLQDEIMKNTDDTCIFDWVGKPSTLNSYLARHPSCFHQPTWHPSAYQSTAEIPVLGAVSDFTHKLSAGLLRIAEELLKDPPLGHFIANGRMNLRIFVHQVKTIQLAASTTVRKEPRYTYHIRAESLEPLSVVISHKFPTDSHSTARSLCIGKVWDNALRAVPTKTDGDTSDDATGDTWAPWSLKNEDYLTTVAKRLREPFVAQLLIVHPNGQFRRVHTEDRIIAQPRVVELLDLHTPRTLIVH
ncbi:HET-domain-containing protein [Gyrodon lividus]|nr:HET-domain-containing protein [Gyrodon lividus]